MRFYALATHAHWIDHLAPIWNALEPDEQVAFYTGPKQVKYGRTLGIRTLPLPAWPKYEPGAMILVASEADRARVMPNKVIRFEHGIGGSFHGGPPITHKVPGYPNLAIQAQRKNASYAGGDRQRNVVAFLNPNHYADDRWREAYPSVPSEIIGTPRMDRWHNAPPKPRSNPPVVAISFHFEATVCPETRSAFPHFWTGVAELAMNEDITLIGHSHPKYRAVLEPFYAEHRVEFIPLFDEVLERADVYAVDSFSTLYEFASTDRPVVVMNAPWFRRDVHHGLRFWEHSDIGPVVDRPEDLVGAIELALGEDDAYRERRRVVTEELYPYRGVATARAVEVLRGRA